MGALQTVAKGLPFLQRARQRVKQNKNRLPFEEHHRRTRFEAGPVHACPLSALPFSGQCPVKSCPGNKPTLESGGCLYLFYGRTRLDKADIMFAYKLNEKKLQDSIAQGQSRVVQAVGFYKALNDIRNSNILGACPRCGVGHQSGNYVCDNAALCESRQTFAETFIKTSNLAFPEIYGRVSDVYLIARELTRFRQLADSTQTNIGELLGIGQDQLKALTDAITIL